MMRGIAWLVVAWLLLPTGACAADAQPRVFFTPQERVRIVDQRRELRREADAASAAAGGAVLTNGAKNQNAEPERVEGVAMGVHTVATAWIGNQRYVDGATLGRYRIHVSPEGVTLTDTNGTRRLVRVNQPVRAVPMTALPPP